MAEIEGIVEGIDDAIGEAEEGMGDLSAEEQAEVETEIAEARAAAEGLTETQNKLQSFLQSIGSCVTDVAKFTAKNVAVGAILWGVNVALNKLLPQGSNETKKRMTDVIKALSDVINAETAINEKALQWMKAHQNDTVTLDGIEVPMESVLVQYIKPLVAATEQAETIATSLEEKVNGKVQFKCPTAGAMVKFMDVTDVFIKAFTELITNIQKIEDKVNLLKSFPINESDLIDLTAKLDIAKALPLW